MKRIFLSLPMSGRTEKEVRCQIEEMKAEFLLHNPFIRGEEIEFVDNYDYVPLNYEHARDDCKAEALLYLSAAIHDLAFCDGVYFGKGWNSSRGCIVEWQTCIEYDIPMFISLRDGSITKIIYPIKEDSND